jgi:hypothetical protein
LLLEDKGFDVAESRARSFETWGIVRMPAQIPLRRQSRPLELAHPVSSNPAFQGDSGHGCLRATP